MVLCQFWESFQSCVSSNDKSDFVLYDFDWRITDHAHIFSEHLVIASFFFFFSSPHFHFFNRSLSVIMLTVNGQWWCLLSRKMNWNLIQECYKNENRHVSLKKYSGMLTKPFDLSQNKGSLQFEDKWDLMRPIVLKLLRQESVTKQQWFDLFS